MRLAVISPEGPEAREISVVHALFAAGLERYHLRKPTWDDAMLEAWLAQFAVVERARIIVHGHPELVLPWGLAGAHAGDRSGLAKRTSFSPEIISCACHDLATLRAGLGQRRVVLLSPLFPSISKPGYGPTGAIDRAELKALLADRTPEQRRTLVYALGGIDESTTEECRRLGFDGVAALGAVWSSDDPLSAFRRLRQQCGPIAVAAEGARRSVPPPAPSLFSLVLARHPIMCLTQDGLALSHAEQARRLCAAGARWIQLRMKEAEPARWLQTAREVAAICRERRAIFIVNDSVEIALQSGADGVHLGKSDLGWREAREKIGPHRLLGGTVNNAADAAQARQAGCLDYVGVGPWRFTSNKKNLAPVLGADGVRALLRELDGLPAWVIGGIEPGDLAAVHATGAAGVAASSAFYRADALETNFQAFEAAWPEVSRSGSLSPVARSAAVSPAIEYKMTSGAPSS